MNKSLIVILFLFFSISILHSQTNKRIDSIGSLISKYNKYVSPTHNFYGQSSIQYNHVIQLYKNANANQLEFIIKSTNNNVLKLYCFLILKRLNYVKSKELAKKIGYSKDSAKVLVLNGPLVRYQNVWSLFQAETFLVEEDFKK